MKTIIATLSLVFLLQAVGLADDLVLTDGRYLQVKCLEANEKGVRVRLLTTGGEIFIPWVLIREDDRERLLIRFGLKEDESANQVLATGIKLTTKTGDEYYGVPITELDGNQIPPALEMWNRGTKLTFKKEAIREIQEAQFPAVEAYSPQQLLEQRLADYTPGEDDVEGLHELAIFCARIGLYEEAVKSLSQVKELDPEFEPDLVANQLTRYEEAAKNQRIFEMIKEAKRHAFYNRYDRGLETLDTILALTEEELSPNLRADVGLVKDNINKRRWEYYKKEVRRGYYRFLYQIVRNKSRQPRLKLAEARKWTRSNLHKEVVAKLAEKYGLDPKSEVQKMWEERVVHGTRVASYGSGTFIVLGQAAGAQKRRQALERAMRQALGAQRNRGRGNDAQGGFNGGQMKFPEPPTKDEWWNRADSSSKTQWMLAYYAENGRQLKVMGERREDCSRCGGSGQIGFSGAQGETINVTCPRCAGHRFDKGVSFK